jgi:diphosphomevalonate decarboxylase
MKTLKNQAIKAILKHRELEPIKESATAFASTNIALCKYWGKRDDILNLPLTDSLSVLLPGHGVTCCLSIAESLSPSNTHSIVVNKKTLDFESQAARTLGDYINLFLKKPWSISLDFNIPIAAGLASSAACYASIARALNKLFNWELSSAELSAIARLGSGSACRSIESGFSHWQAGSDPLGKDSFSKGLHNQWPDLCVGLFILSDAEKPISSREGMRRTRETSILYSAWKNQVNHDLPRLLEAIKDRHFDLLGKTAEQNAMAMHATMEAAWPPLIYTSALTRSLQQLIWDWREDGKAIYFTQDAGPNLKLLFERKDADWLSRELPELQIIRPFEATNE